jgi:hypothetical protein
VTEFYSFDHDLGHFVSIGPGTVSDDGTVITSNVGVGILKAGWHCSGFPQGSGTPNNCPFCYECFLDRCLPSLCKACGDLPGTVCDGGGRCVPALDVLPGICDRLKATVAEAPDFTCKQCGTGLFRTFQLVDPHCENLDLTGATLYEEVTPLREECIPQQDPDTGLICPISGHTPHDLVTKGDCTDHIRMCGPPEPLPMGTCTQSWRQVIKVGSCVLETHTFVFTFNRTATSCSGEVKEINQ